MRYQLYNRDPTTIVAKSLAVFSREIQIVGHGRDAKRREPTPDYWFDSQ